ncbi:MAG: GIY-YIG nuclease family protein [Candidatus Peribacteria bacterium]|nr:MAG: GIY-YIG nuclease family protein [Candidatus Peribacteria bacterium]
MLELSNGKWYYGSTRNIDQRIRQHQQ